MSRLLRAVPLLLVPLVASGAVALEPKKASEVVKIGSSGDPCPGAGGFVLNDRQLPNGQVVTFGIPEGKVLVLTGFSWSSVSGAPGAPVTTLLSSQAPGSFSGALLHGFLAPDK